MFLAHKNRTRRVEIRKNRPDCWGTTFQKWKAEGYFTSAGIAAAFCLVAASIVMLRESVVPYRPGQYVPQDILARVDFDFTDHYLLTEARNNAREAAPHVYAPVLGAWDGLEHELLSLPERLAGKVASDPSVKELIDSMQLNDASSAMTELQLASDPSQQEAYKGQVGRFIADLNQLIVLPTLMYDDEMKSTKRPHVAVVGTPDYTLHDKKDLYPPAASQDPRQYDALLRKIPDLAAHDFAPAHGGYTPMAHAIARFTEHYLQRTLRPTYDLDVRASEELKNHEADRVRPESERQTFPANHVLVPGNTTLDERGWHLLKAEKDAFIRNLGTQALKAKFGLAGTVVLLTIVLSVYVGVFQPRVVRKHGRAVGIAVLLLAMLLMAQLAAIGTGPLYIFGIAPTLLVAMILAIAYDQRFAMGIASMHGILVTVALDQGIGFYLILWVGVLTTCFMLNEVRNRGRLIEISGAASVAMIGATIVSGAITYDPVRYILNNCLYVGAGGLAVGFIVLGILPFIEKTFRITTSMTLLELADQSHALLRRLALEAPGTYQHSHQVATLSEAAAEAIGANSLLCRVASYYHDVGKMNKADYFIENQTNGRNRHLNLSPSVSFMIIIGHVKDGMAMAREYNLPTILHPFIQQHHGTTLVEYFYHRACHKKDPYATGEGDDAPAVSEFEYRYPGPKPQRKEVALVMLADAVESAARVLREPNPGSIEGLVHKLALKRLEDGQFDECDLTMKELALVEKALVKTLTGIYHGRIAYPSDAADAAKKPQLAAMPPAGVLGKIGG